MTVGSNNDFPSVLFTEGTTPTSPAASHQRLFVRSSDHVLCTVNSSGTVVPYSTQAYGNPMTTANDIIIGGASGVPARLATSASKVLTTDGSGVISWTTASAGFANPMTTKGDIILGDTGGTATRLAAGTAGYALISNGAGTFETWGSPLPTISHAIVATDQTLSGNNSWADLGTVGPTVTATVGASGVVKVTLTCRMTNSTAGSDYQGMGVDLSGANTVAATVTKCNLIGNIAPDSMQSAVFLLTGLAAGSTVFTAKYNQFGAGGTSHFINREIIVEIW